MNKKIAGVCLAALFLIGCDMESTRTNKEQDIKMQVGGESDRVSVVKITEFKDDLAYGDYRGIYIITDKKTGKEYIGVSSIGITETGSHGCGKGCTRQDER
nr:MAG TPA: GIY-YIG nuclease superfamily protein [Caudoviricetes sp.]